MSFGLIIKNKVKTKKALRDMVKEHGAENVFVHDTSLFKDSLGTLSLVELYAKKGSVAVIVGPDVYNDRKWFANIDRKKDGTYFIK